LEGELNKSSPHVLFYSESPTHGGAEEYLYMTARLLGNERFRFTFLHDEDSDLGRFTEKLEDAGVGVEKIPRISSKLDIKRFVDHVRCFRRLSPDIVHFNQSNPYGQQYSVIAARLAGIKNLVATYHLTPRARTSSLRGRCFENLVVGLMKCVVVQSKENRDEITTNFPVPPDKVRIIHNGTEDPRKCSRDDTDELREELGINGRKHIVSCAGRLTPQKGFGFLIRAAAQLGREDLAILIAGEGPGGADLRSEVRRLGLDGTISFTGFREDVWKLLNLGDFVVIPPIYEGLPLVLLEAMAAGKAVVATRVYGLADTVKDGETGVLVDPGSAEQLAGAMKKLIEDPGLCREMGIRARQHFEEQYTEWKFRENMEKLYTDTMI
jgi:glycosyltransferase involved in cell wall biosynthesis